MDIEIMDIDDEQPHMSRYCTDNHGVKYFVTDEQTDNSYMIQVSRIGSVYDDYCGDYVHKFFHLSVPDDGDGFTREEWDEVLKKLLPDHGCSCSYDCCGHMQLGQGRILDMPYQEFPTKQITVRQSGARNV